MLRASCGIALNSDELTLVYIPKFMPFTIINRTVQTFATQTCIHACITRYLHAESLFWGSACVTRVSKALSKEHYSINIYIYIYIIFWTFCNAKSLLEAIRNIYYVYRSLYCYVIVIYIYIWRHRVSKQDAPKVRCTLIDILNWCFFCKRLEQSH